VRTGGEEREREGECREEKQERERGEKEKEREGSIPVCMIIGVRFNPRSLSYLRINIVDVSPSIFGIITS
jgi:hypothetical protein